jgi:flavin-dependent dehydrogenase
LKTKDENDLYEYQKLWMKKFGNEFEKQLLARKILERLDNDAINKLFDSVTPEVLKEISNKDDFDFHTRSIIKLLGVKGSFNAAKIIMASEMKNLLS